MRRSATDQARLGNPLRCEFVALLERFVGGMRQSRRLGEIGSVPTDGAYLLSWNIRAIGATDSAAFIAPPRTVQASVRLAELRPGSLPRGRVD